MKEDIGAWLTGKASTVAKAAGWRWAGPSGSMNELDSWSFEVRRKECKMEGLKSTWESHDFHPRSSAKRVERYKHTM